MVPTAIGTTRPQLLLRKPQPGQPASPILIEQPRNPRDLAIAPLSVEQLTSGAITVRLLPGTGRRLRVWDIHNNFPSGHIIHALCGANLPHNFKTIDRWEAETGLARSIKSRDLCAITYQDETTLQIVIKKNILELAEFQGANYTVRSLNRRIVIEPRDVRTRELMIAIPSDSKDQQVQWITEPVEYADRLGVRLVVVKID